MHFFYFHIWGMDFLKAIEKAAENRLKGTAEELERGGEFSRAKAEDVLLLLRILEASRRAKNFI